MSFRVIVTKGLHAFANMAYDEAVLELILAGKSLPALRFYTWEKPTLSCGYNQVAAHEVDFEELEKQGYHFVRRPTGGRLVLHDKEVTYAVIGLNQGVLSGNVTASYCAVSEALRRGLEKLGIAVDLEKGSLSINEQRESNNPCFNSTSRYELGSAGKKLVGSAQMRRGGGILQHGSVLLDNDQADIARFIPGLIQEKKEKLAKILAEKTVYINKLSSCAFGFDEVVEKLTAGFREEWREEEFILQSAFSKEESLLAKELTEKKYGTSAWNFLK